ncbi:MATE family efflux transporter [soil metagenome]
MTNVHARFVTGNIMRHVSVMTFTGALGLMAVFLVDLADLFFLSLLGKTEVTAAIGYAGTLAFANLSLSLGTGIASAALVSRNLGARRPERARELATSSLIYSLAISILLTIVLALSADALLRLLGAQGEALHQAKLFIWTVSPGFVFLAGAVSCSFAMRGIGDARRAMYVTLSGAMVTLALDPIFIFVLGWDIQGAAVANVIADLVSFLVGLNGLARIHQFLAPIRWEGLRRDFSEISTIAVPAMLTQLATPFGNAFITRAIAPFGDEAVSGWAIIGRLIPVAFGIIFSLSGSVGPIIGQNFGAREFGRVRRTLNDGLIFASLYTGATSLLLFIFRHQIAELFQASGQTRHLIVFFCTFIAASWAFAGAQFVANAAFNNLGYPNTSTVFNWAKATVGTIPFALYGAAAGGPEGVLVGTAIGSLVFGLASTLWAYRIAMLIERRG